MTVSSIKPVNNYQGDSYNTKFDFDFLIEDGTELVVNYIDENNIETTLQQGVDYSISGIGNSNGGYIIFPLENSRFETLKPSERISLMLNLNIKQENEFRNSLYFNFDVLEWTFDYIVRVLQILSRKIELCVKVHEGSKSTPDELLKNINEAEKTTLNYQQSAAASVDSAQALLTDIRGFYNQSESKYNDILQLQDEVLENVLETKERVLDELNDSSLLLGKASVDLSNLSPIGESHFVNPSFSNLSIEGQKVLDNKLNTTQVSNCILEIPQRIKVEIVNGNFVIKAGSVVTRPNGFESDCTTLHFDYVTIPDDITCMGNNLGQQIIFVENNDSYHIGVAATLFSGSTPPINPNSSYFWYDTSSNIIKRWNGTNWNVYNGLSLPVAIATSSLNIYTSIDQVFNGFGFIGSTVWIDKDVKYLVPNGINKNGTLNNTEVRVQNCRLWTWNAPSSIAILTFIASVDDTSFGALSGEYTISDKMPIDSTGIWYNTSENKLYTSFGAGFSYSNSATLFQAIYKYGKIESIKQPKTIYVLKNSDIKLLSKVGMPSKSNIVNLILGASGSTYTAPANGYFNCRRDSSTSSYLLMVTSSLTVVVDGQALCCCVPILKGDNVTISYSGTVAGTPFLNFIYAEGEV